MIIEEILKLEEEWKSEIDRLHNICQPIILFGAGSTSEFILQSFKKYGLSPIAFCDNDKSKHGKTIEGVDVLSVDECLYRFNDAVYYITTQLFYSDIYSQLVQSGVQDNHIIIYDLICQFPWERNYKDFIREKRECLEVLYNMLDDAYSRKVFLNRLSFLVTRNRNYAVEVRSNKQYFLNEFIDYSNIDLFIDAGLFTGDTVEEFAKYCDISEKVILGFEMDPSLCEQARNNLAHLAKIFICNKAISDSDGIVETTGFLGEMQSIEANTFDSCSSDERKRFETCKLDTILKEIETEVACDLSKSFIKMDIEGAEMSALRGAEEFIKKYHPTIAVCVYHKADDIITIPRLLLQYCEDYRFYLRHYSDNQTETVLYAIYDKKPTV